MPIGGENIPLLLVKTPSNVLKKDQMYYNSVKLLAEKEGIPFIDFNKKYEEIGLDVKEHFYDKSHLNYKGAEKFSRFFTKEILTLYPDLPSGDKNNTNHFWDADLKQYREYCMNLKD